MSACETVATAIGAAWERVEDEHGVALDPFPSRAALAQAALDGLHAEGFIVLEPDAVALLRDVAAQAETDDDGPVLAAGKWATNAELLADVARLGYLRDDDRVIDPTYGRGTWWRVWRPAELVVHDLRHDGVDFRALPYEAGTFDAAAFDPPYVSVGGRSTTTLPDLHDRFGLTDAPTTPAGVQELINDGLLEVARVVKPRGYVLAKCQDYISGGKLWPGTYLTTRHALDAGLELVDRLEHVTGIRPQPPGRRQVHARRNLSTLLVFRTPRGGAR